MECIQRYIKAHGLNPNAVKAMNEVGIDISNQTSDIIDPELINQSDLVVTLCSDADDRCPMTPPHVRREHWGTTQPRPRVTMKKNGLFFSAFAIKLASVFKSLQKRVNNQIE
ncbi:hypothetical protein GCM10008915_71510 [Bifidobacterium pullorum subsp. gallinarum]